MHIDDLNLTSEVISLIELLEESRIVGGYVRDIIRFAKNRIVQTDLDLATVLKPEEVIKKLNNFNILEDNIILSNYSIFELNSFLN